MRYYASNKNLSYPPQWVLFVDTDTHQCRVLFRDTPTWSDPVHYSHSYLQWLNWFTGADPAWPTHWERRLRACGIRNVMKKYKFKCLEIPK